MLTSRTLARPLRQFIRASAPQQYRQNHNDKPEPGAGNNGARDGHNDAESNDPKHNALPAPGESADSTTVDMSEGTARLSTLGPLVINADGTTGTVANWHGMTEHEKETTLRLLKRRNKQRLEALKAKGGA